MPPLTSPLDEDDDDKAKEKEEEDKKPGVNRFLLRKLLVAPCTFPLVAPPSEGDDVDVDAERKSLEGEGKGKHKRKRDARDAS